MTQIENFSINIDGTEYECQRTFVVDNVATQEIFVTGVGSKTDSHPYEQDQLDSMPAAARRIAREIIGEQKRIED